MRKEIKFELTFWLFICLIMSTSITYVMGLYVIAGCCLLTAIYLFNKIK